MSNKSPAQQISTRALIFFFVLAYLITWGLSLFSVKDLLPVALPPLVMNLSGILLHYGPAIAAIIVAAATCGRAGLSALFGQFKHWRVGIGWYLFIFLFPVLLRLLAAGINILWGGNAPQFFQANGIPNESPLLMLPVVFLLTLFQAGLAEEIGWRGFGLPGLQQRFNALVSSLILGAIWCVWHFHPLNFSHILPFAGWYFLNVMGFTILLTWVYNNTRGSLLLAVLFHTASNVSDWIVPNSPFLSNSGSLQALTIQSILVWIVVIVVIVVYGPRTLRRQSD